MTHARLCLLCQAGPVDECNEVGTLLTVWAPPAQRLGGGPIRFCDVWDTRCPTCTSGSDRSCFMRCMCSCDGCTVWRVWYAPDKEELSPEEQWCNMPDGAHDGQGGSGKQEEQGEETRAEREMREDLLHRAEGYGAPGEVEEAQRAVVGRLEAA